MDLLATICDKSRRAFPHIVLAEGEDERVAKAALRAHNDGLAKLTLIGRREQILAQFSGEPESENFRLIDPSISPDLERYIQRYVEMRRHKGVGPDEARKVILSNVGFAAMMVSQGDADGTLGGAATTTATTVRAALQIIGKAQASPIVSSFFLMLLNTPFSRPVIFADCALIIEPDDTQLAYIAMDAATSFETMTGIEPRIALLAFSTLGSADHLSLQTIRSAVDIIGKHSPHLAVDGEIQFDAAMDPEICARKAPHSPLAGAANIFIFPNLHSGNIGYKIAQRLGHATALGPILQGLAKPANDLSRGCNGDDVYNMIAITGAQTSARQTH